VPLAKQGLKALDLGEISATAQRVDCVLKLERGRNVTDDNAAGPERARRLLDGAAGFREVEEHPVDAGFVEALIEVAELDSPVGGIAEKGGDVLARGGGEVFAHLIRDYLPVRTDRAQQRDRESARAGAALDHRGAGENVSPYQQRSGVFRVDDLGAARQMGNQVGVSGTQEQKNFARAELDPRPLVEPNQLVGKNFTADSDFAALPQAFQVTPSLAVDEQDGVVRF